MIQPHNHTSLNASSLPPQHHLASPSHITCTSPFPPHPKFTTISTPPLHHHFSRRSVGPPPAKSTSHPRCAAPPPHSHTSPPHTWHVSSPPLVAVPPLSRRHRRYTHTRYNLLTALPCVITASILQPYLPVLHHHSFTCITASHATLAIILPFRHPLPPQF